MDDTDNFIGTLAEAKRYIKLICQENRELDRENIELKRRLGETT